MPSLTRFSILVLCLVLVGCNGLRNLTGTTSPHQQYAQQLERAGLHESTAGEAWLLAAQAALDTTVVIDIPASEAAYFDPQRPEAVGYQLDPHQGEELTIVIRAAEANSSRLFADLFEIQNGDERRLVRGSEAPDTLTIEASGNPYVLRLQPELLGGGQFELEVTTAPTLAFPVAGHDGSHIRSVFGDPRDGGARQHQGVDIFAPRGTPVVAAAAGIVRRTTGDRGLGGKTVWVTSPLTGSSYYYAHLDSVLVSAPTHVSRGDTLGLVGNTGNARHTPPHLHFEVRPGRPVDPFPYINTPRPPIPTITASTDALGRWMRTNRSANLRSGPSTRHAQLATFAPNTPLLVTGSTNGWHRVLTPAGKYAYIAESLLEPAQPRARTFSHSAVLRHAPTEDAPAIAALHSNTTFSELGRFGDHLLVRTVNGQTGWLLAN